jgi:hypothetical protein
LLAEKEKGRRDRRGLSRWLSRSLQAIIATLFYFLLSLPSPINPNLSFRDRAGEWD